MILLKSKLVFCFSSDSIKSQKKKQKSSQKHIGGNYSVNKNQKDVGCSRQNIVVLEW